MIEKIVPASTESELTNSTYAWAVMDGDLQEHGSEISSLKKRVSDLERTATRIVANSTKITLFEDFIQYKIQEHVAPRKFSYSNSQSTPIFDELTLSKNQAYNRLFFESDFPVIVKSNEEKTPSVPLWALLEFGASVMGLTALASIIMWLIGLPSLLNPFVSLLTIVAAPFTYLMGVASKHR